MRPQGDSPHPFQAPGHERWGEAFPSPGPDSSPQTPGGPWSPTHPSTVKTLRTSQKPTPSLSCGWGSSPLQFRVSTLSPALLQDSAPSSSSSKPPHGPLGATQTPWVPVLNARPHPPCPHYPAGPQKMSSECMKALGGSSPQNPSQRMAFPGGLLWWAGRRPEQGRAHGPALKGTMLLLAAQTQQGPVGTHRRALSTLPTEGVWGGVQVKGTGRRGVCFPSRCAWDGGMGQRGAARLPDQAQKGLEVS